MPADIPSRAGYWGAVAIIFWIIAEIAFGTHHYLTFLAIHPLFFPILTALYVMVLHERVRGVITPDVQGRFVVTTWRWRSASVRYGMVLMATSLVAGLVHNHYYFMGPEFSFTRDFYFHVWGVVVVFGLPYMLITLRYKGGCNYDFNDFGIITLAGIRGLTRAVRSLLQRRLVRPGLIRASNWRVRKTLLVYLANTFFLTLMTRFFATEWTALTLAIEKLHAPDLSSQGFFECYHAGYLLLYHLIFTVDTGLAIVAYTVSSRWLDNRVKSIDTTMLGWCAALACYPPFNSALSTFIGFNRYDTVPLINAEWLRAILMGMILACLFIYVWATMALGFKFGNLVNRGIVTGGPYRYLKHPAYLSKNISWWLDNTHVLTHPGATIGLGIWNMIYWIRAKTEEKHLEKDPAYRLYKDSSGKSHGDMG